MVSGNRGPFVAADRVPPLLARLRQLRQEDLEDLDDAVTRLAAAEGRRHRTNLGFYYAWYEGPSLRPDEGAALDDLFSDVCVAVSTGVCGIDVVRFGARPAGSGLGALTSWQQWLAPPSARRQLQESALRMLEAACAPFDPRLAMVACWNAACAVTCRDHLPPDLVAFLEAAWRNALGEPPGGPGRANPAPDPGPTPG